LVGEKKIGEEEKYENQCMNFQELRETKSKLKIESV
jgi:hypothetical protein